MNGYVTLLIVGIVEVVVVYLSLNLYARKVTRKNNSRQSCNKANVYPS